jgi:hypothetical protein
LPLSNSTALRRRRRPYADSTISHFKAHRWPSTMRVHKRMVLASGRTHRHKHLWSAPTGLLSLAWLKHGRHRGGGSHHFGPDAAPRGQLKPANRHPKSGRGPKGPIRKRLSGQFFGRDEDDADGDVLNRENFTRRQSDSEPEDDD